MFLDLHKESSYSTHDCLPHVCKLHPFMGCTYRELRYKLMICQYLTTFPSLEERMSFHNECTLMGAGKYVLISKCLSEIALNNTCCLFMRSWSWFRTVYRIMLLFKTSTVSFFCPRQSKLAHYILIV